MRTTDTNASTGSEAESSLAWSKIEINWRLLNESPTKVTVGQDESRGIMGKSSELPILQAINLLAQLAGANGFAEKARQEIESGLAQGKRTAIPPSYETLMGISNGNGGGGAFLGSSGSASSGECMPGVDAVFKEVGTPEKLAHSVGHNR